MTVDEARTFPYEANPGSTHWDGCWKAPRHHNCAVAEVYRAHEERSRYEGLLALADKWFDTGTSLMAGVPVETDEGLAFTAAHHLGRQGAGAAFIAASTELRAALTPSAPAEKEG